MDQVTLEQINGARKNTIAEVLGIEFTQFSKEKVVATMPVDHRTHQPIGLLHGGASLVLAETLASMGGWLWVAEEGKNVVGQEINANHLRSVRSGIVTGVGEPIHIGRNSQVWEVKIYDEAQKLICISRCTLAVLKM